jgi:hypothetical protein
MEEIKIFKKPRKTPIIPRDIVRDFVWQLAQLQQCPSAPNVTFVWQLTQLQ